MNLETQRLINRFEEGGALLKYAVCGLSDEHAQARPGPGAWSIAEVTAHMADSDLVATDRMKRVIAEDNPILLAYDENAWIEKLRSNEMPIDESANLFDVNRRWIARILRRCSEQDFARRAWPDDTRRVAQHLRRSPGQSSEIRLRQARQSRSLGRSALLV